MWFHKEDRRAEALRRELQAVYREESRQKLAAQKARPAGWKESLSDRIPVKVYTGLESAFCKGFSLVFEKGTPLIEKTIPAENRKKDYARADREVETKGGRREFRKLRTRAKQGDLLNLTMTTVEGIGLGALGVGMPDIVLFLSTLLKGIYENAMGYGVAWDSRREQLLILQMMEAALRTGGDWVLANERVNAMLHPSDAPVTEEEFRIQLKRTASAFAVDMLVLKFIQGLPVVGVLGGAANPVYYRKVMKYVQLKYRRRYLEEKIVDTVL